jgi:hypothetical protein
MKHEMFTIKKGAGCRNYPLDFNVYCIGMIKMMIWKGISPKRPKKLIGVSGHFAEDWVLISFP